MQMQTEICEPEEPPSSLEAFQDTEDEPPSSSALPFPAHDLFENPSPTTILPFPLHRQKSTASPYHVRTV